MSTIKISQLGNVAAFTNETIIPVVANVSGTLTTLKSNGDAVRTFVLGTLETDLSNVESTISSIQEQILTIELTPGPKGDTGEAGADGLDGLNGLNGMDGNDGASAYQLYLNSISPTFVSEQQWLDSLIGIQGIPGLNGLNGAPGAGVPEGGTAGQVLTKIDSDDFNTQWVNTPVLGNVALSDDYNDLINTPNLTVFGEAVLAELETIITNGNITYGNLIPDANVTYNLGSESAQWKDLYLSGNTIYLGGTAISIVGGNLAVDGAEVGTGADGLSAYEVAVANGYSDNEDAWLASLIGPAGENGANGQFSNILTTVAKTGGAQETPTAIDLTQFVNKLSSATAGRYTLADGVEGQLMYLTRQDTGSTVVKIANARVEGTLDTNSELTFQSFGGTVITLLFIDGAWQQGGGEWLA
jgi:hypothetical protein